MTQRLIGRLAAEFGINPRTLRYYEARRLLTAPQRTAGGYRIYDDAAVRRLGFIANAKNLGLTLAEIRRILAVRDSGKCPCDSVRSTLQSHVERIDRQIVHLNTLKADLNGMLAGWRSSPRRSGKATMAGTVCPRIETRFNGSGHPGSRNPAKHGGDRR